MSEYQHRIVGWTSTLASISVVRDLCLCCIHVFVRNDMEEALQTVFHFCPVCSGVNNQRRLSECVKVTFWKHPIEFV